MDALEKFQKINGLANVSGLLMTPATRAYLKELLEAEEKAAREKARGMTDEEWEQANDTINQAFTNAGKSLGEAAKEAAAQIQVFADMVAPYLPDRPKHSKKRGRKTTW